MAVLLVLCATPGLLAAAARAQPSSRHAPFSTVSVYAGGNALLGAGQLASFYESSPGLDVAVATPFYAGVGGLEAGVRRLEARDERAREDLWAAPLALHWGLRPSLGRAGLRLETDLRLGVLVMRFSRGSTGLRNESELLMGAGAGLSLPLGGRWRLAAGARYERVFTSTPFSMWQARVGVRRRFDAPGWLQTLLR